MKVIAHRGLSAHYPENTLLAFEKSLAHKIDGIEFDLPIEDDNFRGLLYGSVTTTDKGQFLVVGQSRTSRPLQPKAYFIDFNTK